MSARAEEQSRQGPAEARKRQRPQPQQPPRRRRHACASGPELVQVVGWVAVVVDVAPAVIGRGPAGTGVGDVAVARAVFAGFVVGYAEGVAAEHAAAEHVAAGHVVASAECAAGGGEGVAHVGVARVAVGTRVATLP